MGAIRKNYGKLWCSLHELLGTKWISIIPVRHSGFANPLYAVSLQEEIVQLFKAYERSGKSHISIKTFGRMFGGKNVLLMNDIFHGQWNSFYQEGYKDLETRRQERL